MTVVRSIPLFALAELAESGDRVRPAAELRGHTPEEHR